MIWSVPHSWEGETAVILAGGPSLRDFDAQALRGRCRVITINDSWRMAPWGDVLYFQDASWREMQVLANKRSLDGSTDFSQLIYSGRWVSANATYFSHPHVKALRLTGVRGFDPDPAAMRHGCNSGYQAIHLAAQLGAKRILLLGYDMRCEGVRTHWHDETRPANFRQNLAMSFLPHFDGRPEIVVDGKVVESGPSLKEALRDRGIEVINCTPGSALRCWPYLPLEQALETTNGKSSDGDRSRHPSQLRDARLPELRTGPNHPGPVQIEPHESGVSRHDLSAGFQSDV